MSLLWFLIFGLIVGALARLLFPGPQKMGWIPTLLTGMAGAFLGGLIGQWTGIYREGEPAGFFMAIIGAIIVLWVVQLARGKSA